MPPKEAAPDPEIPEELRVALNKPHRPLGYAPKSDDPDIQAENAPEVEKATAPRNLKKFWPALAKALETGVFIEMPEEYQVRVQQRADGKISGWTTETRTRMSKQKVLDVGANGLPYLAVPVAASEVARIKALPYRDGPKMDPGLGDLTPAFVEWLYLNHPYEATVRYYGRQTHVQIAALDR